ncbi:MAG: hypothetical protein ACYC6Y_06490 [Thermoguttaceae bacterium]
MPAGADEKGKADDPYSTFSARPDPARTAAARAAAAVPVSAASLAGPHGGRITGRPPLAIEVVYLAQEIRVYLYGLNRHPESARDVQGEIALRRRDNERTYTARLHYVAPSAGSPAQDYLAVQANLRDVKDAEMTSTIRLKNLTPERPEATFTQIVALSKIPAQVTPVEIRPDDLPDVTSQAKCPVTGAALDSMEGLVKVLIGRRPLYLCCNACVGLVQRSPESYLEIAGKDGRIE